MYYLFVLANMSENVIATLIMFTVFFFSVNKILFLYHMEFIGRWLGWTVGVQSVGLGYLVWFSQQKHLTFSIFNQEHNIFLPLTKCHKCLNTTGKFHHVLIAMSGYCISRKDIVEEIK